MTNPNDYAFTIQWPPNTCPSCGRCRECGGGGYIPAVWSPFREVSPNGDSTGDYGGWTWTTTNSSTPADVTG